MLRTLTLLMITGLLVACQTQGKSHTPSSWIDLRDKNLVKQNEDYSCGSASLATLLHYQYGVKTDEADVLKRIARENAASLKDLKRVAHSYGFTAESAKLPFTHLRKFTIPVIVHLVHEGQDHFSVLHPPQKDSDLLHLADPSWGNRRFTPQQFQRMWLHGEQTGIVMYVVPR